jgi:hypothetical protein
MADNDFVITLKNVRLSYFYGFKPYKNEDGGESYCTHAIFGEDHPQLAEFRKLQRKVAEHQWKDRADAILQQVAATDKLCLHRGDINKPGQEAYKGKLFVSASSKLRPTIVDGSLQPLTEEDGKPYSGAWADVRIALWAQDNKYGKRINAQLMGVQFRRHDERLSGGGRVARADEFEVIAEDADGEAPASSGAAAGLI